MIHYLTTCYQAIYFLLLGHSIPFQYCSYFGKNLDFQHLNYKYFVNLLQFDQHRSRLIIYLLLAIKFYVALSYYFISIYLSPVLDLFFIFMFITIILLIRLFLTKIGYLIYHNLLVVCPFLILNSVNFVDLFQIISTFIYFYLLFL